MTKMTMILRVIILIIIRFLSFQNISTDVFDTIISSIITISGRDSDSSCGGHGGNSSQVVTTVVASEYVTYARGCCTLFIHGHLQVFNL